MCGLGLSTNGFLAGQLAWPAWLRLGVLSCIVALGHARVNRRKRQNVGTAGALTAELLAGGSGEVAPEVVTLFHRFMCVWRVAACCCVLESALTTWLSCHCVFCCDCNLDLVRPRVFHLAHGCAIQCASQTPLITLVPMSNE